MSVPVISEITSLDDGKIGVRFNYGPTATEKPYAWRAEQLPAGLSVISSVQFTAATSDIITLANGITPTNGMKFRLGSDDTLPAGLAVDTDVYAINSSGQTCKLSLTSGGSAIDITGTGTGTHFIYVPETLGLITGVPTGGGFWNVKLYASNASGESVALEFTIGIQNSGLSLPGVPLVKWDWDTDEVTPLNAVAEAAADGSKPVVLFGTNQDKRLIGVVIEQGGLQVDVALVNLNCGVHYLDTEPLVFLGDNAVHKIGQDETAIFVMLMDLTVQPAAPSESVQVGFDDKESDAGTGFDGQARLQARWISEIATSATLPRTSRLFNFRIERSDLP